MYEVKMVTLATFQGTCYDTNFHKVNTRKRYQVSVVTIPLPEACSNSR